ncbi:MAG: DUF1127 domain-containing protein [Hyphomicrobiaceae bacterium]|nr:DUF1127 domain-containing protein [Hyphomicrobiaceae bacterium]
MRHERSFPRDWVPADGAEPRCSGRAGPVVRRWRAFQEWRARRAAEAWLHALDERMLKDIGLCRAEIGSAVRGGGWRHPSYEDAWRWPHSP